MHVLISIVLCTVDYNIGLECLRRNTCPLHESLLTMVSATWHTYSLVPRLSPSTLFYMRDYFVYMKCTLNIGGGEPGRL